MLLDINNIGYLSLVLIENHNFIFYVGNTYIYNYIPHSVHITMYNIKKGQQDDQ